MSMQSSLLLHTVAASDEHSQNSVELAQGTFFLLLATSVTHSSHGDVFFSVTWKRSA